MSNLHRVYSKILGLLHEIEKQDNFLYQIRVPKLSDKELIALSLAAESLGIDSEHFLFKQLPSNVEGKIERSVYNRRIRRLRYKVEDLRRKMVQKISSHSELYIIDSMPLEVCKFSRAKRSKVCQQDELSSPDYGFCAAQKLSYFG